jgi:hypothetical protein
MTTLGYIRAVVAAGLAITAALTTALIDGSISPAEIATVAGAGLAAVGVYLGVGTQTSLEPSKGAE